MQYETGLNRNYSENAVLAKMTNEDALNIMYQLRDGVPISEIAKTVPDYIAAPESTIYSIRNGKSWNFLAKEHGIVFAEYEDRSRRFTDDQLELIGFMLSQHKTTDEIITALGFDLNTMDPTERKAYGHSISDIKVGRNYTHITEKYGLSKDESRQNSTSIFNIEELNHACRIFESGFVSYDDTLTKMGYDVSSMTRDERFRYVNALSALRRRKNYPEITKNYHF